MDITSPFLCPLVEGKINYLKITLRGKLWNKWDFNKSTADKLTNEWAYVIYFKGHVFEYDSRIGRESSVQHIHFKKSRDYHFFSNKYIFLCWCMFYIII